MARHVLWQVDEAVSATGGRLQGKTDSAITGVSIDTRSLAAGDLFVAIRGDTHDGHSFVARALSQGATLALVSRIELGLEDSAPLLVVPGDPLKGLEDLGCAARARSHAKIIAVTGSVGKTSTKEMLRLALSQSGLTHASAASYNNHWGVPLTLARMPREAAYGVFEIGMNHRGEISPLTRMVRPHIAIITTVAPVHIGNFASVEDIADAKAEIIEGVNKGGYAVLNHDNPFFERMAVAARSAGVRVVSFGKHGDADVRMVRLAAHADCSCITAQILGEDIIYKLGMPGEHMAMNSLAVLAAVKLAGADLARAALALAAAEAPKGRGEQHRLTMPAGPLLLIDESYNANPVSMAAALALLRQARLERHGRRIAVLGDMLELGEHGAELHAGLAVPVAEHKIDMVFTAGPLMEHLWARLPAKQRGYHAATSADLVLPLFSILRPGDAVMVKGSLGSRMGLLIEALKHKFPVSGGET